MDNTPAIESRVAEPRDGPARRSRRPVIVYSLVWAVYLAVLTATALFYFPWRKPPQKSFLSSVIAGLPEEKRTEALELQKKFEKAIKPSFFGEFKQYRRMPCWSETARDELVGEPSIGDRGGVTLKFDFAEPVKAWDRFALEMLYGIGIAAFVQGIWALILYLKRRRSKPRGEALSNKAAV